MEEKEEDFHPVQDAEQQDDVDAKPDRSSRFLPFG